MTTITLVPATRTHAKIDLEMLSVNIKPTYGTGGYLSELVVDRPGISTEYCRTRDKAHRWVLVFRHDEDSAEIFVLDGDADTIKALVQAEFEHFDIEVEWAEHEAE